MTALTAQAALDKALLDAPDGALGIAVSGGGDSIALLVLMAQWARTHQRSLRVATVDHGLRPESRAEAEGVARTAASLDLKHDILFWEQGTSGANLQDRARRARRTLLAGWAADHGLAAVALGHTRDDQAETFLLRLARGSGVDGLTAMRGISQGDGAIWLRPLLDIGREELRTVIREQSVDWAEDPSNADGRFARVRMRQLMPLLSAEGLDAGTLAGTAERMQMAQEVLNAAAQGLAATAVSPGDLGYFMLDLPPWRAAQRDTRLRLLAEAVRTVGGAPYRPRYADLKRVETILLEKTPDTRTLSGCIIRSDGQKATICREPAAAADPVPTGQLWDGRWQSRGPQDTTVGMLGQAGLQHFDDWRDLGHPKDALQSAPAIWKAGVPVATPWKTDDNNCRLQLASPRQLCFTSL